MKKYIYPGIFYKENDSYWMEFPDLAGCQSFGDTLTDLYIYAREALSAYCKECIKQGIDLCAPSDVFSLSVPENAFVSLVEAKFNVESKNVKKTLSIPSWLNDRAVAANINFSQTLQKALRDELQIDYPIFE